MKDKTNRVVAFFLVVGLITLAGIVYFWADPDEIHKKKSPVPAVAEAKAGTVVMQEIVTILNPLVTRTNKQVHIVTGSVSGSFK